MTPDKNSEPRQYKGVMVSSTFTDLTQHRQLLMEALRKEELFAIAMEEYVPIPADDVISSSLNMVRKSSAYIGLISHRYGQPPESSERNPFGYSVTRLEFEEAQRLGLPTLIFVMGDEHPVRKSDVETDPDRIAMLKAFRETAKKGRIYRVFNSLDEFSAEAIHAVAALRRHLDATVVPPPTQREITPPAALAEAKSDPIPTPPTFYAEPPYIGSHKFVGRQAQLDTLSDWASPVDGHPVLLVEAIGGTGKSILTWEWTTLHSCNVRNDWAGRFWYSFYERGATMVDFCRKALAYMTGQPRANFKEKNTAELAEVLLHQLYARPWLIILDGLERVLVSYHRFDAAQIRDDEAGMSDTIARRDPRAAINPEDEDLLRAMAGGLPSKMLLTSRLIPRALLNKSNQPIPGVLHENLPGLRPVDAEALIRWCGVTGTSIAIQDYLKRHCDCHPLVVGVLAGLIIDYLPNRGNFDAWVADPAGGGQLNFAKLDLVQKRNHILNAALTALPETSRQLLSTLALLSGPVDYPTLCALNPRLPPIPVEVPIPKNPDSGSKWRKMTDAEKIRARDAYHLAILQREEYESAVAKREPEMPPAVEELAATVKDLERRGLLQYDTVAKRHDLHPVVRAVAAGGLKHEEKNRYGQRLVDYFSQRAQDPYDQAESLEDFDNARHIVKVLLQMGRLEQASDFVLKNTFLHALSHRFEAHNEILEIIRPFFSAGWQEMPAYLEGSGGITLARSAAVALRRISEYQDSFEIGETALHAILERDLEHRLCSQLMTLASTLGEQNQLAKEDRLLALASRLVSTKGFEHDLEGFRLARFRQLSILGRWPEAAEIWSEIEGAWLPPSALAVAKHHYAVHLFLRNALNEEYLKIAENANRAVSSALGIRNLCGLRGSWHLDRGEFEAAKNSLQDAVALARKVGKSDLRSEIRLARARLGLGELANPTQVARDFEHRVDGQCQSSLAELWFKIGDIEKAKEYAVAAYTWAWGDGAPYVRRHELDLVRDLLEKLDAAIPELDSGTENRFSWEANVVAAIDKVRANGTSAILNE